MDIWITDLEDDTQFQFPLLPETIDVDTGARFQSYDIMNIGEVKLPFGETLTSFSWSGTLPGRQRVGLVMSSTANLPGLPESLLEGVNNIVARERQRIPYLRGTFKDPKDIQSMWSYWRAEGKKLRLLITETPVNHDVYLDKYSVEYSGGFGDIKYSIHFTHAKDLKVYTEIESETVTPYNVNDTEEIKSYKRFVEDNYKAPASSNQSASNSRPVPPGSNTYTVKDGDTLFKIASVMLGSGWRYPEIHAINQPPLGPDPDWVSPGQVLVLPER